MQNDIQSQLKLMGRFSPTVTAVYAGLTHAWYAAQAARIGTTADALYARYPLRVMGASLKTREDYVLRQAAWHGSEHRGIENLGFSLDKIGTGEGNQTYGWGIYFAGKREVAEAYRAQADTRRVREQRWAPMSYFVEGKEVVRGHPDYDAVSIGYTMREYGPVDDDWLDREIGARWLDYDDTLARLAQLEGKTIKLRTVNGQLYSAEIPEDHALLDWDKPLSSQPAPVIHALKEYRREEIEKMTLAIAESGQEHARELATKRVDAREGQHIYRGLPGGPRAASEALRAMGIPGLRYLDQGSRDAGEGTYNYVIWEETHLNNDVRGYFQSAWHGSAYRGIEKEGFRLGRIGSGEGEQAYGWGIYFAASREVAENYRRELTGADGKPARVDRSSLIPRSVDSVRAIIESREYLIEQFTLQLANADLSDIDRKIRINGIRSAQAEIEEMKRRGALYRADIPGDEELLDWDKPLTDQPGRVFEMISIAAEIERDQGVDTLGSRALRNILSEGHESKSLTGRELYEKLSLAFGKASQGTDNIAPSFRGASEYLKSIGIPGLRYLDGGSRNDGGGTHNYVIWDESRLNDNVQAYYQSAWHGTRHRGIENTGFELQRIGTGEGNQTFGWGIYFSSVRDVAEHYRRSLSIEMRRIREIASSYDVLSDNDAVAKLRFVARAAEVHHRARDAAEYEEVASWIESGRPAEFGGQLYSAEVPEDSDLLDWDKRLSEQPATVRMALGLIIDGLRDGKRFPDDPTGERIYSALSIRLAEGESPGKLGRGAQAASEALLALGIPGLRYLDGYSRADGAGTHNYVIWDERRLNHDVRAYYQPEKDVATVWRPRGAFDPESFTITLLRNADRSTFLHESGHFYLEALLDMGRQIDAKQRAGELLLTGETAVRADIRILLDWFGVRDLDHWDKLQIYEKRRYHEQFAEGFELYLFEGKAPNVGLRAIFGRCKDYLRGVYQSLQAFLASHPDAGRLTDDVRGVFNRMFSAPSMPCRRPSANVAPASSIVESLISPSVVLAQAPLVSALTPKVNGTESQEEVEDDIDLGLDDVVPRP